MPRSFRGYEVEKKIGSGGMSTLYLGIQKALNRQVAIKMLHPGLAEDEQFIARFEREAKAASAIGHRNIVSVIDFGSEDDIYYIVMELVQGMDMKQALEKTGTIPPEIVLAVLEEVSYGLEAAHDQGVIHRDIKPGNVMISQSGEVKIADFGLARQSSDIARISALTLPGSVLGTPAYMSPEQAAGKEVDHRTDIYSLGVMAYELFTGTKPFAGSSYSEIRDKIINSEPEPITNRAAVTPEIESLVNRLIAKEPDRRFPSIRHVMRHLEDCMETLDPSGGLIKYRRKYLGKFAQNPKDFSDELRRTSISSHLDRGFFYKKMGMAKIDDAVREFRYVLFLDPDNTKAVSAITELEKEAEESGVRMPDGRSSRVAVEESEREDPFAPDTHPESGTRILPEAAGPGATQILDGAAAEASADRRPAKGAPAWIRPAGIGAAALAVVLVVAWFLTRGGGEAGGGSLELASDPAGAAVLIRGGGETEFRDTGRRTPCVIEDLGEGTWDVRLALDGYRTLARRVPIAGTRESLNVALVAEPTEGRLAVRSTPDGATVGLRRPGDGEFRLIDGVTPLTTEPLASGEWEVRVTSAGTGESVQTARVEAGQTASLVFELGESTPTPPTPPVVPAGPTGTLAVTTDPAGSSIRLRPNGKGDWNRLDFYTPGTTEPLAAGEWEVRVDKTGYERATRKVQVKAKAETKVDFDLVKLPTVQRDGFVQIVIVPFADVYLDGRIFETQARRTVIPVPAGKEHRIELRHPAFGSKVFPVNVSAGDTTNLGRYDFKYGTVRVFCEPKFPADLYIDGEKAARQTPFLDKIGSGTHRFAVEKSGYRVKEVRVIDANGGEQRLSPNGRTGDVEVRVPPEKEIRIQFILEKGS